MQTGFFGSGHQSPCSSIVSVYVAVFSWFQLGFGNHKTRNGFDGIGKFEYVFDHEFIDLDEFGFLFETFVQIIVGCFQIETEHVEKHTQHKHVFCFFGSFVVNAHRFEAFFCQCYNGCMNNIESVQSAIVERIGRISQRAENFFLKTVFVGDNGATFFNVFEIGFKRGRVESHENVALISRSKNFFKSEMYLET
ncbi:hypothetical protein SDC9_80727 [bioreactor metagenome]|uniref:Uncharacterized protein n=1 Tax=bioreactor metagenome TaxID=1076179 RepID=A0A644YZT4_9ZZZZ